MKYVRDENMAFILANNFCAIDPIILSSTISVDLEHFRSSWYFYSRIDFVKLAR